MVKNYNLGNVKGDSPEGVDEGIFSFIVREDYVL